MPRILIPDLAKRSFIEAPRGEVFGNIWATRGIDYGMNLGKIRLSLKLIPLFDNSDDANMGIPSAFERTDADGTERYMVLAQSNLVSPIGSIWKTTGTNPLAGWTADTLPGTPTDLMENMLVFGQVSGNDRLLAARSTDIAMLNAANVRTLSISSSTDTTPIKIVTSGAHGVSTGDIVTISGHQVNTNANGTWTITYVDATSFTLNGSTATGAGAGVLGSVATNKWINGWWTNVLGQSALSNTNPHYIYKFANLTLVPDGNALHVIDDSLVVKANRIVLPKEFQIIWINDDGNRVYIGTKNIRGGEAYVFPWSPTLSGNDTYERPKRVYDSISFAGVALDGKMHVINGKGQLLVDNGVDFSEVAALPVVATQYQWKDSFSTLHRMVLPNGMKIVNEKFISINVNAAINGNENSLLQNMPSGIWEYNPRVGLYPKYLFSKSRTTVYDWGASAIVRNGALYALDKNTGYLLAGAAINNDSSGSTKKGIFYLSSANAQRGRLVTVQMSGGTVRSFWQRLQASFSKLANAGDTIVFKYRTAKNPLMENLALQAGITWTSTTQFTTVTDISAASVGDEIDVLLGNGAGALAHITAISLAGGTYTVTIDETISNASGTAQIIIQNRKKLGSVTDQTVYKKVAAISKRAKWIELSMELRGGIISPEVEQLQIEYQPSLR